MDEVLITNAELTTMSFPCVILIAVCSSLERHASTSVAS